MSRSFLLTFGGIFLGLGLWVGVENFPFDGFWKVLMILFPLVGLGLVLVGVAVFGSDRTVKMWLDGARLDEKGLLVTILSLPVLMAWTLIGWLRKG